MKKQRKSTRIIIRIEKNGKYVEKRLTQRMVCALFDLQYMIDEDDVWHTLELNKMDKDMHDFFRIMDFIDDASHGSQIGYQQPVKYHVSTDKKGKLKAVQQEKKIIKRKREDDEYLYGKPRWKRIKKHQRK